jgi:hypothetical protein
MQNKIKQTKASSPKRREKQFCYLCANSGLVPRGYADQYVGTPSCWTMVPCPKCVREERLALKESA